MVSALALVVTESAIEVGSDTFVLVDMFWENITTWLGLIVAVFVAFGRVNKILTGIFEVLKLKASQGDVDGLKSELTELKKFFKEVKELQEISAFANIDNKFLDEETKTAFARVLSEYNTAETLTKEQFIKIKSLLEKPKE